MSTPRELAHFVAGIFGIHARTLLQIDRALVDGDIRKSFGRGNAARRATAADASALIIATAGAPLFGSSVSSAPATFDTYAGLPFDDCGLCRPLTDSPFRMVAELTEDHSFGQALAVVIDSLALGDIPDATEIVVEIVSPWPSAEIAIYGSDHAYGGIYKRRMNDEDVGRFKIDCERMAREHGTGLLVRRRVSNMQLRDIAAAIAGGAA